MKMFLTRLGFNSKMIITGDLTQTDLPSANSSGLEVVRHILDGIAGVAFVELTSRDVVRHRVVAEIIDAYQRYENFNSRSPSQGEGPGMTTGDKRPSRPGEKSLIRGLLLVSTVLLAWATLTIGAASGEVDLRVGELATRDYVAQRSSEVTDQEMTEALREAAAAQVESVTTRDESIEQQVNSDLSQLFEAIRDGTLAPEPEWVGTLSLPSHQHDHYQHHYYQHRACSADDHHPATHHRVGSAPAGGRGFRRRLRWFANPFYRGRGHYHHRGADCG